MVEGRHTEELSVSTLSSSATQTVSQSTCTAWSGCARRPWNSLCDGRLSVAFSKQQKFPPVSWTTSLYNLPSIHYRVCPTEIYTIADAIAPTRLRPRPAHNRVGLCSSLYVTWFNITATHSIVVGISVMRFNGSLGIQQPFIYKCINASFLVIVDGDTAWMPAFTNRGPVMKGAIMPQNSIKEHLLNTC